MFLFPMTELWSIYIHKFYLLIYAAFEKLLNTSMSISERKTLLRKLLHNDGMILQLASISYFARPILIESITIERCR